jgi:hypothetical protein
MGYSAIVTITLNLAVNFGYIILISIKELFYKLRFIFYTWKRNSLLKKQKKLQEKHLKEQERIA